MPNRYPLIANPSTSQIQELASGDNIDLSGNDIVGVVDITATGNISTSGSIVAGGVSYPTAVGGDGQVLTSDGAGGTAWEDASVSGLPSGDAGESLVFRGDTWVISPQNFDVATNHYDSDWNSVLLMIPFDSETGQPGTAGWETPIYGSIGGYGATPGTSFTASGISETVHTVGNVSLSSTGAKFGGNSVRFTGQTTGYIEFPDTNKTNNATGNGNQDQLVEIGTGNFTMEFWFKVDHLNWIQDIVSVLGTSSNNTFIQGCWTFRTEMSGAFKFHDLAANANHEFLDGGTGNQIVADTWYHAAISRDNNVLRLFLDGVEKKEVVVTTDYGLDSNSRAADACLRFGAGQPNAVNGMEGNIDDFRITKGIARYLAGFTPPTQGFANTATVVYGDITYPLTLHTDVDLVTNPPTNGQVFTWDATGGPSETGAWIPNTISDTTFVGLTDTPVGFTADKWLKVNAGGTALEWADASTDTNDYVDAASLSGTDLVIGRTGALADLTVDLSTLGGGGTQTTASQTITGATLTSVSDDSLTLTTGTNADISMIGDHTWGPVYASAENKNPSVTWDFNTSSLPTGVTVDSYSVLLEDLTASFNGTPLVHWDVSDIPATTTTISADATAITGATINQNFNQAAVNTDGVSAVGYSGPQPPTTDNHVYRLSVTAHLTGSSTGTLTQGIEFNFDTANTLTAGGGTTAAADNLTFTYTTTTTGVGGSMTSHIIPDTNAAYDIGSAEYKVRHIFLSNNSLWIGDDHKIDIAGGKMKFRKRNKSTVPASITDAGGDEAGALAHSGKASLELISCFEWLDYLTSLDPSKTDLSDLFPPEDSSGYTDDDYEEIINQEGPGTHPAPIVSGVAVLSIPLFTGNTFVLDQPVGDISLDVVGAKPTPGNNIDFKVYVMQGATARTISAATIDGVPVTSIRVLGATISNVLQVFEFKCLHHNGGWNAIITAE